MLGLIWPRFDVLSDQHGLDLAVAEHVDDFVRNSSRQRTSVFGIAQCFERLDRDTDGMMLRSAALEHPKCRTRYDQDAEAQPATNARKRSRHVSLRTLPQDHLRKGLAM